jgi:hypothetical protein
MDAKRYTVNTRPVMAMITPIIAEAFLGVMHQILSQKAANRTHMPAPLRPGLASVLPAR